MTLNNTNYCQRLPFSDYIVENIQSLVILKLFLLEFVTLLYVASKEFLLKKIPALSILEHNIEGLLLQCKSCRYK